uniref:Green fluorescent protein n=1 Tax=Acropora tenuis TaxID=70783 RepID=A0A7U3V4C4_ACRTE|nr:green fluorescent protein [Acropora tenuis]
MTDYFKQAFPDGMSYERSFLFEDGGVATATATVGPFGGGYHRCQFDSTFKTEKPVILPPNHVREHYIARTDLGQTAKGFTVKLEGEAAATHVSPLKADIFSHTYGTKLISEPNRSVKVTDHFTCISTNVIYSPNHVREHYIARTDLGQTAKGFTVKLEGQAAAHVNPLKVT